MLTITLPLQRRIHDNDFVVHNDESIEQMTGQLDEIFNALRARAAA